MTYYSVNRACGVLLLDFLENMGTYWLQWLVVFFNLYIGNTENVILLTQDMTL